MSVRPRPHTIVAPLVDHSAEDIDRCFTVLYQDLARINTLLGAALTPVAGGVCYSTSAALALSAAGTSGQWLTSGGTGAPTWSSPAALTRTSDTNVTLTLGGSPTTALLNAASITVGWTGQLAVSRGGTAVATFGGTNTLLYTTAVDTLASLATANAAVLVTNGSGAPAWGTDLPTAVTIGAAYIYRAGGTDVAVADGGTGLSSYTTGDLLYASAGTTLAGLAAVAVGQVLTSAGTGAAPAWSASPSLASVTLATGGALRTGTTAADTVLLQAYDTDTGPGYVTFGTLTAGGTPTFDLSTSVTMGGAGMLHE